MFYVQFYPHKPQNTPFCATKRERVCRSLTPGAGGRDRTDDLLFTNYPQRCPPLSAYAFYVFQMRFLFPSNPCISLGVSTFGYMFGYTSKERSGPPCPLHGVN